MLLSIRAIAPRLAPAQLPTRAPRQTLYLFLVGEVDKTIAQLGRFELAEQCSSEYQQ